MSATRSTFRRRLRRAVTVIALAIAAVAASLSRLGTMRTVRASASPRLLAGGLAAVVAVTGLAGTGASAVASAAPGGAGPSAAAAARSWVATRPARLRVGPYDGFVQHPVITSAGWSYVPYDRTYRGLPVVGGDFVVVVDPGGRVCTASVAQRVPIGELGTVPALSVAAASAIAARAETDRADKAQVTTRQATALHATAGMVGGATTQLVVYALGATPRLAWQASDDIATTYVDASSGAVLGRRDTIAYGTGNSARNGPNPIFIATRRVHFSIYDRYYLIDPSGNGISCRDYAATSPFMQTTDRWGDGDPLKHLTGCVDAMFAAQTQMRMLAGWLGRSGVDGNGHGYPMRVGGPQHNAFWNQGIDVIFGQHEDGRMVTSLDLVGHELGHGVDQFTPGGPSDRSTKEFIGDAFGAATEWYANEPAGYDTADYVMGDGFPGWERYMYDPGSTPHPEGSYSSPCFNPNTATEEVHLAAGVGDHWFYLLAEGSNPTNGQPPSPTDCPGGNHAPVTGVGIQTAIRILYTAMLMKTSNSSYPAYRLLTLQAAANLYGCYSAVFSRVRAAWNTVIVPVQPGEPQYCGPPN